MEPTADAPLPRLVWAPASSLLKGAPKAAEPDPLIGKIETGDYAPKHILIVESDPAVRDLVAGTVSRLGFHVDTARDGEEGWTALSRKAYDLVITDNEMPKLTGLNLIKRLRSVSNEPPCILISGKLSASEPDLRGIVDPVEVLPKPFTPTSLIEKVFGLLLHGNVGEF